MLNARCIKQNNFIDNKYHKWYLKLIDKAQHRKLSDSTYYEKHHIIPKCVGGKETIRLTAREHFIAHRLLTKFTSGILKTKMCAALLRLCYSKYSDYLITSHTYSIIKNKLSENMRGANNPCYGRKAPPCEVKARADKCRVAWNSTEKLKEHGQKAKERYKNPEYKSKWKANNIKRFSSPEYIEQMSQAMKKGWALEEHKKKLANKPSSMKGKHHTLESKEKNRIAHLRENLSPETIQRLRQSHLNKPKFRYEIINALSGETIITENLMRFSFEYGVAYTSFFGKHKKSGIYMITNKTRV